MSGEGSLTGHTHPHMPRVERAQVGHSDIAEGEKQCAPAQVALYALDVHPYAPLNVTVTTPLIELRGASDDLLQELVPLCLLYTSPSPRD